MNEYQKILKNLDLPEGKSTEQAWSELEPKLGQSTKRGAKVVQLNWKPLAAIAAAAAVVIMAVVFVWPSSTVLQQQTLAKETKTITLPDQSTVTLNANSSIEYSSDWSNERIIRLTGEAFFNVQKGNPFKVISDNGIVKVLGTSFDVFAREEKYLVSCVTGKVAVTAGNNEVLLSPGNMVELKSGMLETGFFSTEMPGWMEGEFIYSAEPLQNVIAELERQFGINIQCPDLSDRVYTGFFSNKNLNEALELVFAPMKLSYSVQTNNTVVVSEMD